jgi:hypothetical protein
VREATATATTISTTAVGGSRVEALRTCTRVVRIGVVCKSTSGITRLHLHIFILFPIDMSYKAVEINKGLCFVITMGIFPQVREESLPEVVTQNGVEARVGCVVSAISLTNLCAKPQHILVG